MKTKKKDGTKGVARDKKEKNTSAKVLRIRDRLNVFISERWAYFAAPIVIFTVFFIVLAAYNAYPFSKRTSISNYDLLAQICPFIEHFYDVIEGRSSLFYSTSLMGGADFFGTLAYCAVSPFTFLFLLVGKGNVYYAASYVLPLKLSAIAISAIYYIRKKFPTVPDYIGLAIGIVYSYCGYTFVANTYINWMDFLIYMPFVAMGFEKIISEGRIRYFAVSYALMIYTCFSIASFALLSVYLIFIAYAFICVDKSERKAVIYKTCLALVLAVGLALPIMVPSLTAYIRSGRNTGLFENMNNALSDKPIKAKISYVISDTLFLFLIAVYFVKNGLKRREDVFYLVAGAIIMAPVLVDEVTNLMNAGSYMSYALRFGFLNAFYGLHLSLKTIADAKNEEIPRKKSIISLSAFFAFALAAIFGLILYNYSVVENKDDKFSGDFAHSLGGVKTVSVISLIVLAVLVAAFVLYKYKFAPYRLISLAVIAVLGTQICCYNVFLVKGNTFDPVRYEQYRYIAGVIENNYENGADESHYRIKDYDDAISNAAALTTHTECFSVFSSVIDSKNLAPTKFFNYDGNKINCIKSSGGLFLGDALLGYKYYYIHNDSYKNAELQGKYKRAYNTLLEDTKQPYFQGMRNELCFPNAFVTYSGDLVFGGNYYDDLNTLYKFLGGDGEIFDEYEVKESDVSYDESQDVFTVKVRATDEGHWFLYHDFGDGYDLKFMTAAFDEEKCKPLGKDTTVSFGYYKSLLTNYCHIKNYSSKSLTKETVASSCRGLCLPVYKVRTLKTLLDERAANYKIVGGNKFEVKANAESDEAYLFMNYVALDGFKIKVNGKDAEFTENGLNFMVIKLDEGENEVTIEYKSPYIGLALLGVGLSAIAVLIVMLLLKTKDRVRIAAENVVFVSAAALAIAVLGFFIIYPTGVFFVKLLKLLF